MSGKNGTDFLLLLVKVITVKCFSSDLEEWSGSFFKGWHWKWILGYSPYLLQIIFGLSPEM